MADTSDFRNGTIIKIDGKLFSVVEFQHIKVQQRRPIVRTRLKQIPEGYVLEKTLPGVRGDTAQGGSKRAILETGTAISVPLFIEAGNILRIDTRTGRYIERA